MGYGLLPAGVLSFFLGLLAIMNIQTQDLAPPPTVIQAEQSGQTFIAYRNAVVAYQQNNPTFAGSVSNTSLAAQGDQFPSSFLASAGNAIAATGAGGYVVTCFAALPGGAISAALHATDNDVSIGVASGTTWTSAAYGSTATPLATTVPNGAVVSVLQIGN